MGDENRFAVATIGTRENTERLVRAMMVAFPEAEGWAVHDPIELGREDEYEGRLATAMAGHFPLFSGDSLVHEITAERSAEQPSLSDAIANGKTMAPKVNAEIAANSDEDGNIEPPELSLL